MHGLESYGKKFNPDHITDRGNEGAFEKIDVGDHIGMILESHDRIISNPDFFIGSGNNAVVYNTTIGDDEDFLIRHCIKGLWKAVSVEIKGKDYSLLPKSAQSLRKIQDYFEKVKTKRREQSTKGYLFRDQVDPETEARYSNRARMYLKREGSLVAIPEISEIIHIERGEESYESDPPFSWEENVDFLLMEKVQGATIEQIITEKDKYKKIRDKINFEQFSLELEKAIDILHRHGLYHNDLSNRNIMVNEDGLPVLIDFGGGFNFPKGQSNGEMYLNNKEDLKKTLKWLNRSILNPDKTQSELKTLLDD